MVIAMLSIRHGSFGFCSIASGVVQDTCRDIIVGIFNFVAVVLFLTLTRKRFRVTWSHLVIFGRNKKFFLWNFDSEIFYSFLELVLIWSRIRRNSLNFVFSNLSNVFKIELFSNFFNVSLLKMKQVYWLKIHNQIHPKITKNWDTYVWYQFTIKKTRFQALQSYYNQKVNCF